MYSAKERVYSIDELKEVIAPIAEKHGVERIYLFGSVARGDGGDESDYDFCVDLGKIRDLFEFSEFFQDIRQAVGRDIDVIETKSAGEEFLKIVRSEGVIVYEER